MWVICVCLCVMNNVVLVAQQDESKTMCRLHIEITLYSWNIWLLLLLLLFVASFDVLLKYKMLFRTVAHMVASMLNKLENSIN